MKHMSLTQKTQLYFKKNNNVELTEEQTRIAMMRLMQHYKWLAKWYSEDKKQPASTALLLHEGEYNNAC
jgi:hypothetical protein